MIFHRSVWKCHAKELFHMEGEEGHMGHGEGHVGRDYGHVGGEEGHMGQGHLRGQYTLGHQGQPALPLLLRTKSQDGVHGQAALHAAQGAQARIPALQLLFHHSFFRQDE